MRGGKTDAGAGPAASVERHLDGTSTEYFEIAPTEPTLMSLLSDLFEHHWADVIFGPCIQGAVFEGKFAAAPRLSLLDGYLTVEVEGSESWHFHLCIGPHRGSLSLPTPPDLAAWRQCARAAFFRGLDRVGRQSTWGVRMWNGRDEQMITIFLPNPWLDPTRTRYVTTPDWTRLELWMSMRARYAGVEAEAPPAASEPPRTH